MADVRESFPTLEGSSQEGLALRSVQEGDSVASKNGALGFAFKDDAGNAVAPQLNASGELPVVGPLTDAELRATPVPVSFATTTGDGKKARGTVAGNASLTTVATLSLTASKIYENLDVVCSCFRDARFQVIQNDNGAETILADILCGPGQLTSHVSLREMEFTTGATGTQSLIVKALNLNALSDFYAAVSIKQAN